MAMSMTLVPTPETVRSAPKVLLHDHLDGGLRPLTVIELAHETGYRGLPTDDIAELTTWFRQGGEGSRVSSATWPRSSTRWA